MKNIIKIAALAALIIAGTASCKEDVPSSKSILVADEELNDFDRWLEVNYVLPYNVEFKYRYTVNESNTEYYSYPTTMENAIILAHILKYSTIEALDEVGGLDFTREYFPKMIFMMGGNEYKNNGSTTLGTAEGGKKITLMGVNNIKNQMYSASSLRSNYLRVFFHEFTHILNQRHMYSSDFDQITGNSYQGDSWAQNPGTLSLGYISDYSRHSGGEDFAEMVCWYVLNGPDWMERQINSAGDEGGPLLKQKLEIVTNYMRENFNIELSDLYDVVTRRLTEIGNRQVDLTSLAID